MLLLDDLIRSSRVTTISDKSHRTISDDKKVAALVPVTQLQMRPERCA